MRAPLAAVVVLVGVVLAIVGSLGGAPLITAVAARYGVSLATAQWTLTVTLLAGAVSTPVLGRLGSGPRRRAVVLGTLAVVVAGSAVTVLPLPYAALLAGRAAQGTGLALPALLMAVARDHLEEPRAATTIATLSVASTAGVGVGYPLAGLLADAGGVRAAYGLGLVLSAAALVAAAVVVPAAPARPVHRVDVRGALLLAVALTGLLLVLSRTDLWTHHLAVTGAVLAGSLLLLAGWTVLESRTAHPLVDVRLLRRPAVAAANVVMLTGGAAMYLLLSIVVRYAQTPAAAGYGFGLTGFEAGLVLLPFSALGFVAGRLVPRLARTVGSRGLLAAGAVAVLAGFVLFALARSTLAEPLVAMSALGLGVGTFSAAMPGVILAAVPRADTAAAMSVNQVVRSVGFSIGSALSGLVLAAYTADVFPRPAGYPVAAWTGAAITVATLVLVAVLRPARDLSPARRSGRRWSPRPGRRTRAGGVPPR